MALNEQDAPVEALGRVGREVVERVDLEAIAARLDALPTAPLLAELDAIVKVLATAADAHEAPRRGVVGRMLGRELATRTSPDPADYRVRAHLATAATQALTLERHLCELEAAATLLDQQRRVLDQVLERGRAVPGVETADDAARAFDPMLRRLTQLEAIAAAWQASRAHLSTALALGRSVLDRHAQVRDVLVPLWRQAAGTAALSPRLRGAEAERLARLGTFLRTQIDALRGAPAKAPPDDVDGA
ncbi:hypothetical protein [Lysobacter humi (ex Lee et al. 2017)]